MTHKQTLMKALLSDKLVAQKKFPKIQVHTRISELRKEGLTIECKSLITPKGEKVNYWELNYKKSNKKALKKYAL